VQSPQGLDRPRQHLREAVAPSFPHGVEALGSLRGLDDELLLEGQGSIEPLLGLLAMVVVGDLSA